MKGLSQATTVFSIIAYPFILLLRWLLYILYWLISPFIFMGRLTKEILMLPVRAIGHFFVHFETLIYFLAFAVAIGLISGLVIHTILRVSTNVFDLDRAPVPQPTPAKGHDAASYRAAREAKRKAKLDKEQRSTMRAKLLASQPLIQEVVREARRNPISGPMSSPKSPNPSTVASKSGFFERILFEHSEEDAEDSAY